MALTIKKATLWRRELENRPGTLAETLKPFADSNINLQVVMGYAYPGEPGRSAVEVYPVTGKSEAAARRAGLHEASEVPCLIVQGDDKAGLAHQISQAVSRAGINISFAVIQVVSRRYQGLFGFKSKLEADQAMDIIKSIGKASSARKSTARRAVGRRVATKTARKTAAVQKPARKQVASRVTRKAGARKTSGKKPSGKKAAVKKPASRAIHKNRASTSHRSASRKTKRR